MTDITLDQIHAELRAELESFTALVLDRADDASTFQRTGGRMSKITAADLITLEMDETLADIEEDPAGAESSIETLAFLHFARLVAARIASGKVLAADKPKAAVARKPRTKKAAAKDAETKAEDLPTPPVTEPEVEPAPLAEVLESDQVFLATQASDPTPGSIDSLTDTLTEAAPTAPVVELTKADTGVLDLL